MLGHLVFLEWSIITQMVQIPCYSGIRSHDLQLIWFPSFNFLILCGVWALTHFMRRIESWKQLYLDPETLSHGVDLRIEPRQGGIGLQIPLQRAGSLQGPQKMLDPVMRCVGSGDEGGGTILGL